MASPSREPLIDSALVAAVSLAVFAVVRLRCGLYCDDYIYLLAYRGLSWREAVQAAWDYYVPARNAFVLFFWGASWLAPSPAALHAFSSFVEAACAVLAYRLALALTGARALALSAALVFALMTHHGESRFWPTYIGHLQLPMLLTLLAFWLNARPTGRQGLSLAAGLAAYTPACFSYDQFLGLWPLLLAVATRRLGGRGAGPNWKPLAAGACYGGLLSAVVLWARLLNPHKALGQPRAGGVPSLVGRSLWESAQGLAFWPNVGAALAGPWTAALWLAALTGGWWLVRRARSAARVEASTLRAFAAGGGAGRLALLGCAWAAAAYLPNWFSYVGPRNHYVPSLGWALALAGGAAWAWGRWPRFGTAAAWLAAPLFANAAVTNIHEGAEWARSAALQRSFLEEAGRVALGAPGLFLVGAPRFVGRALAFNLPHDPVASFAYTHGVPRPEGDTQLSPTRRGLFYGNNQAASPRAGFRWLAAERAAVIGDFGGEGFRCVRDYHVRWPDGSETPGTFRPAPGCARHVDFQAEAGLVSAKSAPARGPDAAEPVPGIPWLGFESAAVAQGPGHWSLELRWRVRSNPGFAFAVVPVLVSRGGRLLYEPVYPARTLRPPLPVLWPLTDDLLRPSDWRAGRVVRERFALAASGPVPRDAWLVLELYRLRPGRAAEFLGKLERDQAAAP